MFYYFFINDNLVTIRVFHAKHVNGKKLDYETPDVGKQQPQYQFTAKND